MRIQGTARIDTQGSMQTTGNSLDMALDGDGYFQVQLPGGQLGYTRAGNFSRSPEGLLVTTDGYQVHARHHRARRHDRDHVGTDGTVSATVAGQTEPSTLGQIQVATFANPAGCRRRATTI